MAGSFFATLQTERLDRRSRTSRAEVARAIFSCIEGVQPTPTGRHSALGYLSPADLEAGHAMPSAV